MKWAKVWALCLIPWLLLADFPWMEEQISEDFNPFESTGITLKMLDETMSKVSEISFGRDLVRIKVIKGEVYGKEGGGKELLKRIASLYPVPDVDVIIQEQDIVWNPWILPGPVLCTSKMKDWGEKLIVFPVQVWAEWETTFVKEVEKASENSPWESKKQKLFWRGVPNDADNYNKRDDWTKIRRGKLCYASLLYPEIIDAAFSGAHPWNVREDLQGDFFAFFPKKGASWEEYIDHKYLICLDGVVSSNPGCAWKLLSNCALFKHDSRYINWYYRILRPWQHYIPLKDDLSDLYEKLLWAVYHDTQAKQIAENGRALAKENLMPEHLYLYCYKVILKYASLQKFTPNAS